MAVSRNVTGSKTTMSAIAPGLISAAVREVEDLGGQCRGRADRLLEREDLLVQGVADLAREGAVTAGVGLVAASGHVRRAVGGGGDEIVPHHGRGRRPRSCRS